MGPKYIPFGHMDLYGIIRVTTRALQGLGGVWCLGFRDLGLRLDPKIWSALTSSWVQRLESSWIQLDLLHKDGKQP